MDTASGSVGLGELVNTSTRLGKLIVQKIQSYRHANTRIRDLIIRIEGIWLKTELQVEVLREISDLTSERFQEFQEACIERLTDKLRVALSKLEVLAPTDFHNGITLDTLSLKRRKRSRFSLLETNLQSLVDDLEKWHSIFDPSWYLPVIRIRDDRVDKALRHNDNHNEKQQSLTTVQKIRSQIYTLHDTDLAGNNSIFLDNEAITKPLEDVEGTSLQIANMAGFDFPVLVEDTAYPDHADRNATTHFVRDMARLLAACQPATLGFLQCLGVVKIERSSQFQYIYAVPAEKHNPRSLRSLLGEGPVSLDARFRLAKELAKSTMSLHTANFVHKNVRPDNVVVFEDMQSGLWHSFLVGFQELRLLNSWSGLVADMAWERNIYRYPTRQGLRVQDFYVMQHDIYSLGVCLLEIGLWVSFVVGSEELRPASALGIDRQLEMRNKTEAAKQIKRILIDKASNELPSSMGQTYTEVVISCLTCLDAEASNMFSTERDLLDEDGILIGVNFIEKILVRLESVQL